MSMVMQQIDSVRLSKHCMYLQYNLLHKYRRSMIENINYIWDWYQSRGGTEVMQSSIHLRMYCKEVLSSQQHMRHILALRIRQHRLNKKGSQGTRGSEFQLLYMRYS